MKWTRMPVGGIELRGGMLLPALAGLAVGVSMLYPVLAPVQLVALAVLGVSLRDAQGILGRFRPGFWFGVFMAAVVLLFTGVPVTIAFVLLLAMALYWTLLGALVSVRLAVGGWAGVFGATGLVALGEFTQVSVLPMFGTAQRFSGAWVDYDATLLLSRWGGTVAVSAGVAFVAFTWVLRGGLSRGFKLAVGALALLVSAAGWRIAATTGEGVPVTVAVCGDSGVESRDSGAFLHYYLPMVRGAAASGAQIVVTPELALFVTSTERDAVLAKIEAEAKKVGVCWVLGYSQFDPKANRAVILNARGGGVSYDKKHWVPEVESYAKHGTGDPVIADADLGRGRVAHVGVMICQDDNYEDVAAGLSRAGVDVVAVPTFDWKGVEFAHLNSSRNRPRDFGYVEARAAIGGVSAIINQAGRVVASKNHLVEGPGYVVATVPCPGAVPTPFAFMGVAAAPLVALLAFVLSVAYGPRRPRIVRD